jgi:hypothetical protein
VTSEPEEILNDSVNGQESLCLTSGFEPSHLSLALARRLVGDYDPALCQQILNISEAQAETVVKPNSMADDIWRKSVSVIVGSIGAY